ncbi:uncharacterized protein DS421_4g125640 [Arachis hypogaea]|nr:uncharacterized protein DS421_4g125640 [Arachis hypogaea]
MDSQISRRMSCILYRYLISVFGGFVQFQTKYVTDEASMQEMFSVYLESRSRISFIELYIKFDQSAVDRDIELEDYNNDSEEEFESNYEVVDPGVDEDQADEAMVADVADVANVLANQQPFVEPSFMRSLDLEAMHAPEFSQYVNADWNGRFDWSSHLDLTGRFNRTGWFDETGQFDWIGHMDRTSRSDQTGH